jgi:CheY-like chemotaxis protein
MSDPLWSVLLVDDEYDSVQMVSKILTYHGIQVQVARTGAEGLELLATHHPMVVVTDLAMMGMDGWEVLNAIRANPATRHIPVVAITAYHSLDVAEAATRYGFDGYFAKPVNPRTFAHELVKVAGDG